MQLKERVQQRLAAMMEGHIGQPLSLVLESLKHELNALYLELRMINDVPFRDDAGFRIRGFKVGFNPPHITVDYDLDLDDVDPVVDCVMAQLQTRLGYGDSK